MRRTRRRAWQRLDIQRIDPDFECAQLDTLRDRVDHAGTADEHRPEGRHDSAGGIACGRGQTHEVVALAGSKRDGRRLQLNRVDHRAGALLTCNLLSTKWLSHDP